MSWRDLTVRYCFPTFNIAALCVAAFIGRVFPLTRQYLSLRGLPVVCLTAFLRAIGVRLSTNRRMGSPVSSFDI
jgi:hypothetical protein